MILCRSLFLLMLPLLCWGAPYQLCLLEDGPNAGKFEKVRAQQIQDGHMKNMGVMFEHGAIEGAGPTGGFPGLRGIFLFGSSLDEARKLVTLDPKIAEGDLKMSCHSWEGPNGVGKAYREAYGKPGFANKMARKVAVLLQKPLSGNALPKTIVSGPLKGSDYMFFALLDTDDLTKVKAELPEAKAFIWFHDIQVWNGVS